MPKGDCIKPKFQNYCLNGAICEDDYKPTPTCKCSPFFTGTRCDQFDLSSLENVYENFNNMLASNKDLDRQIGELEEKLDNILNEKLTTASSASNQMAIGIIIGVLLTAFVLCIFYIVNRRYDTKERNAQMSVQWRNAQQSTYGKTDLVDDNGYVTEKSMILQTQFNNINSSDENNDSDQKTQKPLSPPQTDTSETFKKVIKKPAIKRTSLQPESALSRDHRFFLSNRYSNSAQNLHIIDESKNSSATTNEINISIPPIPVHKPTMSSIPNNSYHRLDNIKSRNNSSSHGRNSPSRAASPFKLPITPKMSSSVHHHRHRSNELLLNHQNIKKMNSQSVTQQGALRSSKSDDNLVDQDVEDRVMN